MEKNLTTDVARVFAAQYAEGKMSTDEYLDLLQRILYNSTNFRIADHSRIDDHILLHMAEVELRVAAKTEGRRTDVKDKLEFDYNDVARDLAAQYAAYKMTTKEYVDMLQIITEKNSLV